MLGIFENMLKRGTITPWNSMSCWAGLRDGLGWPVSQWKDGVRTKQDDLLDVFININNPRLNANEIKAQILDLILAAYVNVSNFIEWAMAEMMNNPEIFDKAVHELDSVVGKHRLVQEYDLHHLNYIKACVKETLRLHPVSPFNLPHMTTADSTVAGYLIPKGSHVLVSRIGLSRNPEVWDDPLTFNPDRYMMVIRKWC
ncbi:putative tyrosine N-monooxygenase [Helianthus annuus]|nr:putative tyrosine N-monooxygenase [Helianthus annuus]